MKLRDIAVAFGIEVDQRSVSAAENAIKGVKSVATKVLGAIGIGFSIAGIANLAESAADVKALKSQFSQVFGDMEQDAADKLNKIADDTGILANRMKGSFTQIAAFSKTTGMEEAEALDIANRSMIAVADSAAFYDRSIENVTESLQSFLKGNFENDAALGLSCTETTRNTAANKLYHKSFKDLSEAQKQLTLLKMVEDANKASGALGQAASESDTWTNQLGNLKQFVTDLKAAAGSAFLKPAVQVLKILNGLVQKATVVIQEMTGETGFLTRSFERFHALVKRLQPAIDRMGQTLFKGISKGIEITKGIVDKLGGVENVLKIAAIAAGVFIAVISTTKIMSAVKAIGGLAGIVSKLSKAFSLANIKILAIIAVVVILALIIEDFINFMNGNDSVIGTLFEKAGISAEDARKTIIGAWNKIKEFLLGVWDFIKQGALMFVDTIKGFFERHGESIRQNFERAWGIIKTFLQGVWTFISQLASTLFGDTEDSIDGSTTSTKDKLLSIWGAILEALSAVWDTLYEVGSAVFNAIATVIETVFGWIQTFWNNWGERILSWFKVLWDSLGGILNGFLEIIKGVANFVSSVFTGDWQGAWEAIKQVFIGIWDVIVNHVTGAWETIKMLFEMAFGAIKAILQAIYDFFSNIFSGIADFVSSTFSNILNGIITTVGSIKDAIVNGFNAAVEFIKGLPGQAIQWGKDFITGLKDGILSGVQGIVDAVKGIGDKIRSFLHFSVPDEGPLTDYESWMPDFMGGLAKGISDNENTVLDKVRGLASGIATLTQAAVAQPATATASTVNNNKTSNITQNVNIDNSYSGGSADTQKAVSKTMKKSATDATSQMARALAFARG